MCLKNIFPDFVKNFIEEIVNVLKKKIKVLPVMFSALFLTPSGSRTRTK